MPIYAFPREDVALVSGRAATSRARGFADPDLDGDITIPWDSLDRWFEEDEEVFVHPRDPFVRVDASKARGTCGPSGRRFGPNTGHTLVKRPAGCGNAAQRAVSSLSRVHPGA